MKKIVAAIAALMLMSGVAVAGDGVYIKGLGKYAMMTNPEVNGVEFGDPLTRRIEEEGLGRGVGLVFWEGIF